jgi:catechol 2,3-dioxygenase-like lactoylglutathione lyase family enzyme
MPDEFPTETVELTHILVVDDLLRAITFYRDVLGAEVQREYGGTSGVLSFRGAWLLLVTGGGPTEDKPGVTFSSPASLNEVSHAMTIRVPDCQAAYNLLSKRGAQFLTPPLKRGAETRCFFHDPDGHLLEISEYRAS